MSTGRDGSGKAPADGDRDPGTGEPDAGKEDSPVSDARVDDAEATESGYRRDDYWREEARDDVDPTDVPEPSQGYAFESPEERAKAGDDEGSGKS